MSFTFLMNYYIGSHHIPLLDDQPTLGFISTDIINYYSYAFRTETDEIKLTITKMTGNVEVLVSLNQTIRFPTWNEASDENGVYITNTEKNTLSKTKIEAFCSHDANGYCIMTVAVKATEIGKESQYVLTAKAIKEDLSPVTKIENGVPQHGSVKAQEWQYFYFKTSNEQPVTAVAVPNGGDPNIYVTIIKDLSLRESEWERPTIEKNLKKSEDSIGADILMLTKDDLKDCSSSCILIFGVQARSTNSAFTLTVTRGITMLKENQAFTDSLGTWGNYKFYEYYRACSGCITVISTSTVVNNGYNVFVNFNTTERITSHQQRGSSDFELRGRGSQELVITPQSLIAKGYKDQPGYFFIEIHSHSNLNYTITVTTNQIKMGSLSKGLPTTYKLEDTDEGIYFSYRHESSKSFFIHIQEEFGFVEVLINAVPEGADLKDHLPKDQAHAQWSTYQTNDRSEIEISSQNSQFCKK